MRPRFCRPTRAALTALAIATVFVTRAPRPVRAQSSVEVTSQTSLDTDPDTGIQTIHVTSREIVVDVMVTDDKGEPVRGLKQSDFTLKENDKPQPIRSFKESGSDAPAPEPPEVRLPSGVYTNSQTMPVSGPVNIFLLDAMHTSSILISIAEQQAALYIRSMPQGTRVAIFFQSQTGLHMLQGFTSDRELLLRAIGTNRFDFGLSPNADPWRVSMATAQGLNQIAAYVSGIKGRKNLFWFAPGAPVNLMRDGGYQFSSGRAGPDMSLVHHLMDTYELLTSAQVAVYPVDPTGPNAGTGCSASAPRCNPVSPGAQRRVGTGELKAEEVADDSGGQAIYNTNDLTSAIAKAIDNGSHIYTLTYVPPKVKDDGHFHHIDVEVDRPGLHLVYRKGYNAERTPTLDAPAPGPALMKAAMEGNAPAATQVLFDVGIWPSSQTAKTPIPQSMKTSKSAHTIRYEVHYGFPATQIAFATQPDGLLHGAIEFDISAYDMIGTRVALLSQTVKIPLPISQYDDFASKPIQFTQLVDLPPGQLTLHIGVLDTVNNKVGTLELPFTVTPNGSAQPDDLPANATPCPPRCPMPSPSAPSFGVHR
jgi:VWFA-related protein